MLSSHAHTLLESNQIYSSFSASRQKERKCKRKKNKKWQQKCTSSLQRDKKGFECIGGRNLFFISGYLCLFLLLLFCYWLTTIIIWVDHILLRSVSESEDLLALPVVNVAGGHEGTEDVVTWRRVRAQFHKVAEEKKLLCLWWDLLRLACFLDPQKKNSLAEANLKLVCNFFLLALHKLN